MKKTKSISVPNNSLVRILGIPAIILMIPFIAMQFTSEVNWGREDFIIIGILLVCGVGLIELVMKKAGKYKVAAGAVVILGIIWLWAELAVGIFTNWGS